MNRIFSSKTRTAFSLLLVAASALLALTVRAQDTSSVSPTLGTPSQSTASVGSDTLFTADYNNFTSAGGISICMFNIDQDFAVPGELSNGQGSSNGVVSATYRFTTAGSHDVYFVCNYNTPAGMDSIIGAHRIVTVSASGLNTPGVDSSPDTIAPTVGAVTPLTATVGTSRAFTASYSDAGVGVSECWLTYQTGSVPMSLTGTGASGSATGMLLFSVAGTYPMNVTCKDLMGNQNQPVSAMVVVSAATSGGNTDVTGPAISSPGVGGTATVNRPISIQASYTDAVGVTACFLYVDEVNVGGATLVGSAMTSGTASSTYTFTTSGAHSVRFICRDAALNSTIGAGLSVTVAAAPASGTTDVTAPGVNSPGPTGAIVNRPISLYTTYSDAVGVTACYLYVDGTNTGTMSLVGSLMTSGTASSTYTFTTTGAHTIRVECTDAALNRGTSLGMTVTVGTASTADVTAPVVGGVVAVSPIVNVPISLIASFTDAVGVTNCYLYVDGISNGLTSRSGTATSGTASSTYTFTTTGAHTARIECVDAATNRGVGSLTALAVTAAPTSDITAPALGTVTPSTAVTNSATTFSSSFTDNSSGVTACYLYIDGVSQGATSRSGSGTNGTASQSYLFTTTGSHTVRIECEDASRNRGVSSERTVTVTAGTSTGDSTAPVIGGITPTMATINTSVTLTATFTDNSTGVATCYLYIDNSNLGYASRTGAATNGTAYQAYVFTSLGAHTARIECVDVAGNRGIGSNNTITVYSSTSQLPTQVTTQPVVPSDSSAPVVSTVYPTLVGVGAATSYAVTTRSNNGGVNGCSFYVNDVYAGAMGLSGSASAGAANFLKTFDVPGTYRIHVECVDLAGHRGVGQTNVLTVSTDPTAMSPTIPLTGPATDPGVMPPQGTLIKLVCQDGAAVDDPCKAVYYYGRDGKRHAFPHERVFFTWYTDFSTLVEVNSNIMSSIPLGSNVTYRPGIRMLKFRTVPQVFVVTRGGILRWIATEELAASFYGPNWNQNVHDLPDSYYSNYQFGADIRSTSDFSPSREIAETNSIDQNW